MRGSTGTFTSHPHSSEKRRRRRNASSASASAGLTVILVALLCLPLPSFSQQPAPAPDAEATTAASASSALSEAPSSPAAAPEAHTPTPPAPEPGEFLAPQGTTGPAKESAAPSPSPALSSAAASSSSAADTAEVSASSLSVSDAQPEASSQPSPAPSNATESAASDAKEKPAYLKILDLRVEVTERTYQMEPSLSTLAELVNAHEQVLSAQCFGSLRETLYYKGYPSDENCRAHIKRVLELDGTSNIALCAQHGIDSAECRQASLRMETGSYSIDSGSWRSRDGSRGGTVETVSLREAVAQKSRSKQYSAASQKVYDATVAAKANPQDYSRVSKLEALARPVLLEACIAPRLALEAAAQPTPTPAPQLTEETTSAAGGQDAANTGDDSDDDTQNDPLSALITSLDATRKTTTVPTVAPVTFSGPNYMRTRLVTEECNRVITQVAQIRPGSSVVQCFLYGPVSYQCIQARRVSPAPVKPSAPSRSRGGSAPQSIDPGGFATF